MTRPFPGVLAASLLLAAILLGGALGGCDGGKVDAGDDVAAVEEAYRGLRDAILQDDDDAFFRLHSRAAREEAVAGFPQVRSRYLASSEEERDAFRALYGVTEKEFLTGKPEELVTRIMPWKSGWRARKELFRICTVKNVVLEGPAEGAQGGERRGVLYLDLPPSVLEDPATDIDDRFLPTVVFVKDPEGWRRKSFF